MSALKIALIEDDEDIVQMYKTKFEMSGCDVHVANDGIEGLKLLEGFKPDIILLDLMMPRMSGIETLTRIRKLPHGDDYKVIVLTNMKDEDTVAKIRKLGADEFVVKAELTPSQVEERIHRVLGL